MEKELICYQGGRFIPANEVCVSPWDVGFLRGYAVFDVMPAINGKAFLWEWHFERLERSAAELNFKIPVQKEEFGEILQRLVNENEGRSILFRTILTGGPTEGFAPVPGSECLFILSEPFHSLPEEVYREGVGVMTLEHQRFMPRVKLTHYVAAIRTLDRRQKAGAHETLYIRDGKISECAQSNFFIVKDGTLITTNDNALLGITQKLICQVLAPELGLPVEIRTIEHEEVLAADEAFFTGSVKGIVPVVRVDEHKIAKGSPGPITQQLLASYGEYQKKY